MGENVRILEQLRNSEAVYVIISGCTRMPYVVCDEDTFDDEIFLFFKEEDAKNEMKRLLDAKNPVQVMKVEKQSFLVFYLTLYPMGVNCMVVDKGTETQASVQVDDLVRRPKEEETLQGRVRVENPQFHLTALYFIQGMRKQPAEEEGVLKELYEEMMVHFQEGSYIVAVKEEKEVPILRQKDGQVFQPVFTDYPEFQKFQNFNKTDKFRPAVVEASKIPEILTKEAVGVTINPFGMNLQLQMQHK